MRRTVGRHTWVAGAAVEHDAYRPDDVPRFGHVFTTPGLFVQDDVDVRSWLALSMSGRLDRHSEYGWFLSPRVSALLRSGDWSTRLSAGTGFFGPTALTEETEAAGLTRLDVDGPLRAERGRSVSIDLTRAHGPATWTVTVFGSRIADPVHVDRSTYVLRNLDRPTTNIGTELLGTVRQPPFALTASYTYVRSRERVGGVTTDVAQTPRHGLGLVAMAENEDGRIGFELYYTGRSASKPTRTAASASRIPWPESCSSGGSARSGSSSTSRTSPTCGSTGGTRSCGPTAPPTAAGPSTPGRPWTAASSTAARGCSSRSRRVQRPGRRSREPAEQGVESRPRRWSATAIC